MELYSKVGFHSGPTGNMDGIGDFWRKLANAGIPIFHKAADGYGPLYEIAELVPNPHNVEHNLIFRLSTHGQNDGYDYDVPPYHKSPNEAAQEHWQRTLAKLPPEFNRQKVWLEPINEVDKNRADWLGRFAAHFAKLANAAGFKVTLFGWASGEPEREGWESEGMLQYLRLCAERPSQAAISLHEYDFNIEGYDKVYPYHIGRFQILFDVCDNYNIPRPTIHITEWGWALNQVPEWPQAEPYLNKANQLYAKFPQIKGAAIWNLGSGQEFGDIHNQTQRLIAPLGQYSLSQRFSGPQPDQQSQIDPIFQQTPRPPRTNPSQPTPRPPIITLRPGAQFVRDVTIPDDSTISGGTSFTKTWRVRNSGNITWRQYRLRHVGGQALTDNTSHTLPTLHPGQEADISISLTAPNKNGTYISDWRFEDEQGTLFGENLFTRIIAEEAEEAEEAKERRTIKVPTGLQIGMNINPDAPHSNPIDDGAIQGLDWVRFVFKLAARENPAERDKINFAFAQYEVLVRRYNSRGVKALIVLNQETVWGVGPWTGNGDWATYSQQLAQVAQQIAARFKVFGANVAYQIWNEGDLPNNPASVYVEPESFALVLKAVAEAIRRESPQALLVCGGLATGPESGIHYLQRCLQALGGVWPVDALGIHPYGRWGTRPPFDWGQNFGTLAQAFAQYRAAFPDMPFWITEIGVAADNEIGPEHYETIADYITDVHEHVAAEHSDLVPVLIWFAWSDWMRNSGIVRRDGSRKAHVFDAYQARLKDRKKVAA